MADLARAYLEKYEVPALSIAIGHSGRLVYREALGWADRERREAATPDNLFRIASVTKPITSVAIFSLIEEGRLQLGDRVFGPGAVLGTDYGRPPYHPHVDQITVEQLLTHTAGGWDNTADDPDVQPPAVEPCSADRTDPSRAAARPCARPGLPYSNFGYCLLGRVIE